MKLSQKQLIHDLFDYLRKTLHLELKTRPWNNEKKLPVYLLDRYTFYETLVADVPCLLMIGKEAENPSRVKKHRHQVEQLWQGPCIYVGETITAYERRQLIDQQVCFIVPYSQIYLPDLGLDLRERFKERKTLGRRLSPAAQTVILFALQNPPLEFTATMLSSKLKYSRMTLSRALSELEQLGLGTTERRGKERLWKPKSTALKLWQQSLPFLRSPIKRRIWIKESIEKPSAGLTALAQRSMLSPPEPPVCAVGAEDTGWTKLPYADEASTEVEIWLYEPSLFDQNGTVDPFSLYLSLRESKDARVEAALSQMMEAIQW